MCLVLFTLKSPLSSMFLRQARHSINVYGINEQGLTAKEN